MWVHHNVCINVIMMPKICCSILFLALEACSFCDTCSRYIFMLHVNLIRTNETNNFVITARKTKYR